MAAVRSRGNTTTELPLAKLLWAAGIRGYRKHWPVAGKPDFAWPGRKVAVFVDGCFWHGCTCKYLPRTNTEFWRNKIEANKRRDRRVVRFLRKDGWTVIRIKECAVRKSATLADRTRRARQLDPGPRFAASPKWATSAIPSVRLD
jgi:DNA mismatch endonuclease (patch repair protein)